MLYRPWTALCAAALALCAGGCAGLFRRPLPDVADDYVRHAVGELRVGAAEADITPLRPLRLAGFDLDRRATGVHSPLKVRAIVFEIGAARVAVVGVDSLGLMRQDVDWIKAGLHGFRFGDVFVCSSHTHAAPDPIGFWGFYLLTSGRDADYLRRVKRGVVEAVTAATESLAPARLRRATARVPAQGLFRNTNRSDVFDRRLTVLQAVTRDGGEPLAALLHVPCHPEVLRRGNTLVSSDFVGDLCERWRAAGLGQAVFVNGAIGALVSPEPRGPEDVARMGGMLFDLMAASLDSAVEVPAPDVEIRRRDVYLPLETGALALARLTLALPRELYGGYLRTGVGYLRIGGFEAFALPGEAEPGYVARLRALLRRPDIVLFGLCDDEVGYILSERDARAPLFEYERSMSPGPRTGEHLRDALLGAYGCAARGS